MSDESMFEFSYFQLAFGASAGGSAAWFVLMTIILSREGLLIGCLVFTGSRASS